MWNTRIKELFKEWNDGKWRASLFAASKLPDGNLDKEAYHEFVHKAEQIIKDLRCALVTTKEAPDVFAETMEMLQALEYRFPDDYASALMAVLQSAIFEQDMGFPTSRRSAWNFDEFYVEGWYSRAIQGQLTTWDEGGVEHRPGVMDLMRGTEEAES